MLKLRSHKGLVILGHEVLEQFIVPVNILPELRNFHFVNSLVALQHPVGQIVIRRFIVLTVDSRALRFYQ